MNKIIFILILCLRVGNLFSQVTISTLQKSTTSSASSIPTIFKGYFKEYTKSNTIFFGNNQNSNTIAIEQNQNSNVVSYGFYSKKEFDNFYNEIDKISLEYGCDIKSEIDDKTYNPTKIECDCNGYKYTLTTLIYTNIVAMYKIEVSKTIFDSYTDTNKKSDEIVGETIKDIGNSILFTTFEDIENNNKFIAVPIVVYINGKYQTPPTCEIGNNAQEAIVECEKAKKILLPSVNAGNILYILDNGQKSSTIEVLSTVLFGYSDWQTYSAQILEKPIHFILTDNPKIGTNKLSTIKNKPVLNKRKDAEGNILNDKLLTKVDIDGDGMPELIYECSDYEGTFYQIYSYKNEKWNKVYEGGYQGL